MRVFAVSVCFPLIMQLFSFFKQCFKNFIRVDGAHDFAFFEEQRVSVAAGNTDIGFLLHPVR